MEGEGAANLRPDQPEDREPPEPVRGADLGADHGDDGDHHGHDHHDDVMIIMMMS